MKGTKGSMVVRRMGRKVEKVVLSREMLEGEREGNREREGKKSRGKEGRRIEPK